MAFFITQFDPDVQSTLSVANPSGRRGLESLDLLGRWVMKDAFLPPFSEGGWVSKRFSSPC